MRPRPEAYVNAAFIDYGVRGASRVAPLAATNLNEIGEYLKSIYAK